MINMGLNRGREMKTYKYSRIKILISAIFGISLISIFAINYLKDIGGYITIALLTLFIGSILIKKQLSYRIQLKPTNLNIEYILVNSKEYRDIYWDKISKVTYKFGMVILYVNNKKTFITRSLLHYKLFCKELYEHIKLCNNQAIDKSFLDFINLQK